MNDLFFFEKLKFTKCEKYPYTKKKKIEEIVIETYK